MTENKDLPSAGKTEVRDSVIFYRSFYEAIRELPLEVQVMLYTAVFEYSLNCIELNVEPDCKELIDNIKKVIDVDKNNTEYFPEVSRFHFNWKGGISPINKRLRASVEYKKWVKSVFIRDRYTCQHCSKIGRTLNAHHIKPFAQHHELRFDVSNGITLCKSCHIQEHKRLRELKKAQ